MMVRHYPALLSAGLFRRAATCALQQGRRHSGGRFGLMLLLALPGSSLGLPCLAQIQFNQAQINQAQSHPVDYPDYWRQNYRAHWRKQWLEEYNARTAPTQKQEASANSASAKPAAKSSAATPVSAATGQTKSGKPTHSSALGLSAAPPPATKTGGTPHTAAHSVVTSPHSAPAAAPKPGSLAKAVRAQTPAAPSVPAVTIQTPTSKAQDKDVLVQTRADLFTPEASRTSAKSGAHLQDNLFASVGDGWKMVAYLVPTLLVIVGSLNLLKRFQARTGRLPGVLQSAATSRQGRGGIAPAPRTGGLWNALVGSFNLNNAREKAGHSIRVIESVPIGGSNVHLLEVRGRVLLLGAAPGGLSLLAEFDESAEVDSEEFRTLLHTAAADMDAIDYAQADLPAVASMSLLEDLMRDTGQAVTQSARRLRTVQEVEADV